jgi:crossover junction endodeoxyribonuclease RuvC
MNRTRVLGIDPGSRFTGYGIVEEKEGKPVSIAFGVIETPTSGGFAIRLKEIYRSITAVIEQYQPHVCAVETLFFAKNVRSLMKLGEARGAALTAVANKDLPVFEYSPAEIKRAVVGYGRSEKAQIQKMVFLLLGLTGGALPFDASDALAVALCHIHSQKFKETLFKQGVLHDRPTPR